MKTFVLLLLFVGMFMVVHGVYEQKFKALEAERHVETRFVPRTYYDEQLQEPQPGRGLGDKTASMFGKASPWFDQFVGAGLDVLRTNADAPARPVPST